MAKQKLKKTSGKSKASDINVKKDGLGKYCELCKKDLGPEWKFKRHIYFAHGGITEYNKEVDSTKTKGITEGLSNVFIENMNKLSVYERPLHCTDTKRETLYIKENDMWEKDGGSDFK